MCLVFSFFLFLFFVPFHEISPFLSPSYNPSILSCSSSWYRMLVNRGLLVVRDVGKRCSWWFSIPGISSFKKDFTKGPLSLILRTVVPPVSGWGRLCYFKSLLQYMPVVRDGVP